MQFAQDVVGDVARGFGFAVHIDRHIQILAPHFLNEVAQVQHGRVQIRAGCELFVVNRQNEGAGAALLLRKLAQIAVAGNAQHLKAFDSMACARARMPKPEVFSERKSSSMMTMGKRNFMGTPARRAKLIKTGAKCKDLFNSQVVQAIDEAALNWGVKVLRYEIKDLTPPKEILHAMQQQITAEREKRALIAASEGRRQEQINIATGEREAFIARSEGEKQAVINKAQGEAQSITAVAEATAQAIERIAAAIRQPGGADAVQLKVAEKAVDAYSKVAADATTTLIVPSNMTEVSALISSAMKMVQSQKA
jgi:hypothetical protein